MAPKAALGVSVRVVFNRLPEITANLQAETQKVVNRNAFAIEAGAKAAVPVKTGTLRRSLHTLTPDGPEPQNAAPSSSSVPLGARPPAGQAYVGASVNYAKYVEYGTSRMRPRLFLTTAFQKQIPLFKAEMARMLRALGGG